MPVFDLLLVRLPDERYERESDHADDCENRDECPYFANQFPVFSCEDHICGVLEYI